MPSHSPEQARLMAAAAHNPQFARKAGVPQGVAREFNEADQRARSSALRGNAAGACPECGGRTRQGVCMRCGHVDAG
jgi:hypothetical protein